MRCADENQTGLFLCSCSESDCHSDYPVPHICGMVLYLLDA